MEITDIRNDISERVGTYADSITETVRDLTDTITSNVRDFSDTLSENAGEFRRGPYFRYVYWFAAAAVLAGGAYYAYQTYQRMNGDEPSRKNRNKAKRTSTGQFASSNGHARAMSSDKSGSKKKQKASH